MDISADRASAVWIFVKMKQISVVYTFDCIVDIKQGNLIKRLFYICASAASFNIYNARFFELLGRDLWPFYKASILCVLGFAPGYAAVLFSAMAASLPLCLLSGAVGGLIAAPVFCGMLDTILRALRDEPGYWWHTYRMAWKQNWRESLLPGAGAGFCLGLWAFLLYALPDLENVPISVWICMVLGIFFLLVFCLYLFAQVVLVSVSQAERLKNAALFMIGFLPRTLAAGAVLCIYWGVMLAWMPYTIPVVLILGFWLPCTLALQIIYPALDKAFHLEKTITARREDEINDLMEQHGHTSV